MVVAGSVIGALLMYATHTLDPMNAPEVMALDAPIGQSHVDAFMPKLASGTGW